MNISMNLTMKDLIYSLRWWVHQVTEHIENKAENDEINDKREET